MTSIYIFYKDSHYSNVLLNKILENVPNIKLLGVSNKINRYQIEKCNDLTPNIIIADKHTINKLKNSLSFKYISLIINRCNVDCSKIICNQLKKISTDTKNSYKLNIYNFRKKVYKELIELSFNPNMVGTHYMLDCIVCSHENPYSQVTHAEIAKYQKHLAIKYNTTPSSINWNMQKSLEYMYKNTSSNFIKFHHNAEEYLGYTSVINHFRFLY